MRIKDDEWNIYRRYSQFFEMHKTVSLLSSLFLSIEVLLWDFMVQFCLPLRCFFLYTVPYPAKISSCFRGGNLDIE